MKTKKIELEVDFIGGQGPLTSEEEKALSQHFKQSKAIKNKIAKKGTKTVKRSSVNTQD